MHSIIPLIIESVVLFLIRLINLIIIILTTTDTSGRRRRRRRGKLENDLEDISTGWNARLIPLSIIERVLHIPPSSRLLVSTIMIQNELLVDKQRKEKLLLQPCSHNSGLHTKYSTQNSKPTLFVQQRNNLQFCSQLHSNHYHKLLKFYILNQQKRIKDAILRISLPFTVV